MTPTILNEMMYDRGRGPELRRCRITVFDLIPYLEHDDYADARMLELWPITAAELAALKQYVADHRDEVMAKRRRNDERVERQIAAQRTPEFQARFWWNTERLKAFKAWLHERDPSAGTGSNGAVHHQSREEFAASLREFRATVEARTDGAEAVCSG